MIQIKNIENKHSGKRNKTKKQRKMLENQLDMRKEDKKQTQRIILEN